MQSGAQTFKFKIAWEIIECIRLPTITCENLAGGCYNPCDIFLLMITQLRHIVFDTVPNAEKSIIKFWQIDPGLGWGRFPEKSSCAFGFCPNERGGRPRLKSAPRPPPSAQAESANIRPYYVKRADFSHPPPATEKGRQLVQICPRCLSISAFGVAGGWGLPPPFV